jgi:isopentenyl-diphosphate delta-isomerase
VQTSAIAASALDQALILVDDQNNTIGYASRRDCHSGDGLLHRAIAVVIADSTGRILLQHRRSQLWDRYWDLTGATHTLHVDGREESCVEAARRCLWNEWHLDAPVYESFAFTYFEREGDWCEHEYCVVLVGRHDGEVAPAPEWAHGYRWATLDECLAESTALTPWARIAFEHLRGAQVSL